MEHVGVNERVSWASGANGQPETGQVTRGSGADTHIRTADLLFTNHQDFEGGARCDPGAHAPLVAKGVPTRSLGPDSQWLSVCDSTSAVYRLARGTRVDNVLTMSVKRGPVAQRSEQGTFKHFRLSAVLP